MSHDDKPVAMPVELAKRLKEIGMPPLECFRFMASPLPDYMLEDDEVVLVVIKKKSKCNWCVFTKNEAWHEVLLRMELK